MSRAPTRPRTVAIVAVAVLAYACALASVVGTLYLEAPRSVDDLINSVGFGTAFLGLPATGAILAVHRPANPIGRTLLALGAGMYFMLGVGYGAAEVALARDGSLAGPLLWVVGLVTAAAPVLLWLIVHLLLYFPDGELVGRARWLSRVATGVVLSLVTLRLLRPVPLDSAPGVPNPYGQDWAAGVGQAVAPLTVLLVGLALVALGRLVARYRMAGSVERTQFRWILASLACIPIFLAAGILVDSVADGPLPATVLIIGGYNLGTLGFSYALYRAVTRRDLYGIGRVLSRSVSYAVVLALLAATYLGLVVALGAAARTLTGEPGDVVVALSTLAVAALFQPLRMRVRTVVDRRFNRARYDAARTIDSFGRGLRDEVSLGAVVDRLTEVSRHSFQPSHVTVSLMAGDRP